MRLILASFLIADMQSLYKYIFKYILRNKQIVALARLASYFLLLSQKKVTKEKATPYRLIPEIDIVLGRQAETRIRSNSRLPKSSQNNVNLRRGSRGF